jgi:hypothetical protein
LLTSNLVMVTDVKPISKHKTTITTPPNIDGRGVWCLQWFTGLHGGDIAVYIQSFAHK